MSPREITERKIVRKLVRTLIAAGYPPQQVWDSGEYIQTKTEDEVVDAVFAVDEATIHFAPKGHGVFITLGEGTDCLCDWHCKDKVFDATVRSVCDWIDDPNGLLGGEQP